ncbi:hypothetical protein HHI36_017188 [Cryptolaemus montrouzieri]|uniref:NADPH--hemoprotein reductase n=1 Tax=Cryptolaemus montrouzieri TaxID=559131 RepID=A0ABD2NLU3_9CUCU
MLYLKSGALTKLFESFSRETEHKSYVQHYIEKCGKELSSFIMDRGPIIYVCGDFIKVLPEIKNSIVNVLVKFCGFSNEESELYIKNMEATQRYIVDSWT